MPPRIRAPFVCPPCLRRPYTTHLAPTTLSSTPPSLSPALSAALPALPPPSGMHKLTPTRRLISVHGPDATRYLQGLTTANIPLLTTGAYSAFLSPQVRSSDPLRTHTNKKLSYSPQKQGRVLFDVFIYRAPHSTPLAPAYIIECDVACTARLLALLARYKLRSKLTARILAPGDYDVWAVWGAVPRSSADDITAADTRAPGLGTRVVLQHGAAPRADAPCCDAQTYRLRRILHGVPEGAAEIVEGVALPLESGMDYMRGVDFRKGCYVGQELTIRTHHQGVVRKRILPVQLYRLGTEPPRVLRYAADEAMVLPRAPADMKAVEPPGKRAGRWLGGVGNVGLALCRLELMVGAPVAAEFRVGEVGVRAFVPEWHAVRASEMAAAPPLQEEA